MEQFIEFVTNHWLLSSAFVILVFLLFITEQRKAGTAVGSVKLTQMMNRENALVLDIRKRDEYKQGHISGSKNIPEADLDAKIAEIQKYKEKPVVVVCNVGMSSKSVSKKLKQHGFEDVYRLDGGMSTWESEKLPVVKK